MKLLWLLASATAALLLPPIAAVHRNRGVDMNSIYRQGDRHGVVGGATGVREDTYGRAAARAAASDQGEGRRRQRRHDKYHYHHSAGCQVTFRPVDSLMGNAATSCAECLTTVALSTGGYNDNYHDSSPAATYYYAGGNTACRDVCDIVTRVRKSIDPHIDQRLSGSNHLCRY
jgi:hypothetical protein